MPGGLRQVRHRLNCGRSGPDDADALIRESGQPAPLVAPRVRVVPTAGEEGVPAEVLDPWNAGQARLLYEAACADHEARGNPVVAAGRRYPAGALLVPFEIGDDGLEERARV